MQRYTWKTVSGRSKIAIFIILLFFLFLGNKSWEFYQPAVLAEGIVGIHTLKTLPPQVTYLLSESLITLDKTGQPQPNIASSWQVNNDATLYTFKLKENLHWNDGSKFKASDIKFDLPDVEINYKDEQTIEFKLAHSFAPFPAFLTMPVFKKYSLTGLGKYQIKSQSLNRQAVMKLILAPKDQDTNLPFISFRFYPDEETAKTAFALGEIDMLLGALDTNNLKNQPSIKEKRLTPFHKLVAVFYNTKDPLLSDKNLRRALNYATEEVPGEEKAKTPIPPFSWAYNGEVRDYQNNLETAKEYLSKVNLEEGKALTLTAIPSLSQTGEQIVQSWKKLGIEAVLRVESGLPQNFQALLISQPIPVDPDQYTLWHPFQTGTNLSKYSSARVEKDLEDARKSGDLKMRKERYLDFQKVLVDDAPANFLYFPKYNVIYRNKVEAALEQILPLQVHQF